MKKTLRSNLRVAVIVIVVILFMVIPKVNVAKASSEGTVKTYQKGNFILTISYDGKAILSVNSFNNLQLAPQSMLIFDGGFDINTNSVYLWTLGKELYLYNYDYQGSNVSNLKFISNDVTSLIRDENKYIIGYVTDSEVKSVPSEEEIKNMYGINSGNNNPNNYNGLIVSQYTVMYNDGKRIYTLMKDRMIEEAGKDLMSTVWVVLSDGKMYCWNYDLEKDKSITQMHYFTNARCLTFNGDYVTGYIDLYGNVQPLPSWEQIKKIVNDNASSTVAKKELKVEIGKVTYKVTDYYGNVKEYVLSKSSLIGAAYEDSINTVYIRYSNGKLKAWNYELQDSNSKVKLVTIASNCSSLEIVNGKIIGYYINGSSTIQNVWTMNQLREALEKQPDKKKVVRAYRVITKGSYKTLYNSEDKKVDSFRLKSNILRYKGIKIKSVRKAEFNSKGNIIIIYKSGKGISINYRTLERKVIVPRNGSYFSYNSKGIVNYLVKKDGTRISLSKY